MVDSIEADTWEVQAQGIYASIYRLGDLSSGNGRKTGRSAGRRPGCNCAGRLDLGKEEGSGRPLHLDGGLTGD